MNAQAFSPRLINGYSISYNEIFGAFDVTHNDIGYCGWFTTEEEAVEYCEKG